MSVRDDLPFIISGGGIGGLGAALALARKGFPVCVFEQAEQFGEIGAGIQLGPTVFKAFRELGVRDEILHLVALPTCPEMRAALAAHLTTRMPLRPQVINRFRDPHPVIHPPAPHHVLLAAPASLPSTCASSNFNFLHRLRM